MGRILALDGTEICKMLSFARSGDAVMAQVSLEDESKLSAREGDVWFEDASGTRFKGKVVGTKVIGSGGAASAVFNALLYED